MLELTIQSVHAKYHTSPKFNTNNVTIPIKPPFKPWQDVHTFCRTPTIFAAVVIVILELILMQNQILTISYAVYG